MEFINSRKHQDIDGNFDKLRQKKFQRNLKIVLALHSLGYVIAVSFLYYPIAEYLEFGTYDFPQPVYFPIDFSAHHVIVFAFAYALICYAIANSGVLAITTCLYYTSLIEFLGNEFHILGISFSNVLNNSECEGIVKEYKNLIEHYQKLLR